MALEENRSTICDDLIGWWYNSNTKKIMPLKRPRSEEECLANEREQPGGTDFTGISSLSR